MINALKNAWGFCDNDKYKVRCTGASIWVFDVNDNQLARFRDVPYTYNAKFVPNTNRIVTKSTAGYLALYDLDTLSLVKKIRAGSDCGQDLGFDISVDGNFVYNAEFIDIASANRLAIYDTKSLQLQSYMPVKGKHLVLKNVECTPEGVYQLFVGYKKSFICRYIDNRLIDKVKIRDSYANRLGEYLAWRDSGFSEKHNNWNKESNFIYFKSQEGLTLKMAAERFSKNHDQVYMEKIKGSSDAC